MALIGGIGCGKTTLTQIFRSFHIDVINADQISRQIAEQPKIKIRIKDIFGSIVFTDTNELDRKKLSSIFFTMPEKKKALEALLHPLVRKEILKQVKQTNSPYCLIELPVFTDRQSYPYLNRVLYVQTSRSKQIAQIRQRDNKSLKAIENIINQQISSEKQILLADDIIQNNGTKKNLEQHCQKLHEYYLSLLNT